MRGKEEKKGREKEEKKRKKLGIKSQNKKKMSVRNFFLCAVVIFCINQNYAIYSILKAHNIYFCFHARFFW